MELRDALNQIADIREQIARAQLFRGYRSLSTGATGVIAFVAAAVQSRWIESPVDALEQYLVVWVLAAVISIVIVGSELAIRSWRSERALDREMSLHAIEQFLPCVIAGMLLTIVIYEFALSTAWMLPGLWAILFGLGVFASRRLLPRATFLIGGWYLLAGLSMLAIGGRDLPHQHAAALAPWTMGITFGIGQLAAAAMLYLTLERDEQR